MDPRAHRLLSELVALPLPARLQVVAAVLDALEGPPEGDGRPTPAGWQPLRRTGEVDGRMFRPAGAGQRG